LYWSFSVGSSSLHNLDISFDTVLKSDLFTWGFFSKNAGTCSALKSWNEDRRWTAPFFPFAGISVAASGSSFPSPHHRLNRDTRTRRGPLDDLLIRSNLFLRSSVDRVDTSVQAGGFDSAFFACACVCARPPNGLILRFDAPLGVAVRRPRVGDEAVVFACACTCAGTWSFAHER